MAIDWNTLTQKKRPKPPCILLYGPEKVGKTTLASEFPAPVFLQSEEGDGVLDINSLGKVDTFEDLMNGIGLLYEKEHDFQTVVLDSITAAQAIVFAEVCARGDEKGVKERIEDFGYGKGYVNALAVWQEVLGGLNALRNDRGMTIIMIAHSKIERFEDPLTAAYNRYDIDLNDKARDYFKRESDIVLLVKPDVQINKEEVAFKKNDRIFATGGRMVWMHARSQPAYAAGNRYGIPEKTLYEPGKGFSALAPYFPHLTPIALAAE